MRGILHYPVNTLLIIVYFFGVKPISKTQFILRPIYKNLVPNRIIDSRFTSCANSSFFFGQKGKRLLVARVCFNIEMKFILRWVCSANRVPALGYPGVWV